MDGKPTDSRTLSRSQARRVDEARRRFEAAWRSGERPDLESALAGALPRDRVELFSRILRSERQHRESIGERPVAAEYLARFPEWGREIAEAFGSEPEPTAAWMPSDPGQAIADPEASIGSGSSGVTPASLGEFDDYEILEEIARGGMGVVYRARQKSLDRLVALKMIRAGGLASIEEMGRFRLEAQAVANLDHPHIVPIFDVGEHLGQRFFSMRLIEGGSLALRIRECVRDPRCAARLVATVAHAVHYAHRRGFIHRDLKPANILLDADGRPHVTDFGLAKRILDDSGLTRSGAIMGTPCYMSPEQASGDKDALAPSADVYSLGAILYELLTGRPPFRAGTVMETLVQVHEREPEPPTRIRPEVPIELAQVALKCLEKNPLERYPTAEALAEDLERYLRGEGVEAGQPGPLARLRRWTRREPELVSHLGALAIMATLTQINHHRSIAPSLAIHCGVMGVLALWAVAAIAFQLGLRKGWYGEALRFGWAATDVGLLTAILAILGALETSLVGGYVLLIAASGLWSSVRLVWVTTALAEVGYGLLVLDARRAHAVWEHEQYPNVFMAALAVTGFVVARQVKRIWSLSRYYEQRAIG